MAERDKVLDVLRAREVRTVEEESLRFLALRAEQNGVSGLLASQLASGAWPNTRRTGIPNAYATSLALIALAHSPDRRAVRAAADLALRWLNGITGREGHWLWRWKFRWFDRQVRFDSSKYGWPWIDGTVSWVAPTALSVVAHHVWRRRTPRVELASSMLLDRACPSGGWNAGNSESFGVSLIGHPDFTAMSLIALRACGRQDHPVVVNAVVYLTRRLKASASTYSLAWAVLALRSLPTALIRPLQEQLRASVHIGVEAKPVLTLALAALALEEPPCDLAEVS